VDVDVIDASELRANHSALIGGPSVKSVAAIIAAIGTRVPVDAAALTALDPSIDGERAWVIAQQLALTNRELPLAIDLRLKAVQRRPWPENAHT
jgi:hypothetical protein